MKVLELRCTSEKFGAVNYDIVGLIASKTDSTGEYFSPTRTFDDSVKWILAEIEHMRSQSPDLYFVP